MNKDELILEIIEKVHDQVQDISRKVDVLQQEQARHGVLHDVNAKNLDEHMARTEASEERLAVIEKYLTFVTSCIKIVTAAGGILLFFVKILPAISHLFHQ